MRADTAEPYRRVYRRMDGRAAEGLYMLVLDPGCALPSDERHEDALKVERDQVAVEEGRFEEVELFGGLWVS